MTIFRDSQWSNGMEVSASDLTNISRFLRSQIFDDLGCGALVGPTYTGPNPNTCYARRNGGAPYLGGSGLAISNVSGVIYQAQAGDVDGNDSKLIGYYLALDELLTTFAAADPTNPRIDLVCLKLELVDDASATRDFKDATSGALSTQTVYPVRKARLTKQVVAGTPGATPAVPTVPSGFVPWAALLIPAAATVPLAANIWDCRVPLGLSVYDIQGQDAQRIPAQWTPGLVNQSEIVSDGLGARQANFRPPGNVFGRLMGVGLGFGTNGAGATLKIGVRNLHTGFFAAIRDLSGTLGVNANTGGPLVFASVLFSLSLQPIWLDGSSAAYANAAAGSPTSTVWPQAVLQFISNAGVSDTLSGARFIVAG